MDFLNEEIKNYFGQVAEKILEIKVGTLHATSSPAEPEAKDPGRTFKVCCVCSNIQILYHIEANGCIFFVASVNSSTIVKLKNA